MMSCHGQEQSRNDNGGGGSYKNESPWYSIVAEAEVVDEVG